MPLRVEYGSACAEQEIGKTLGFRRQSSLMFRLHFLALKKLSSQFANSDEFFEVVPLLLVNRFRAVSPDYRHGLGAPLQFKCLLDFDASFRRRNQSLKPYGDSKYGLGNIP